MPVGYPRKANVRLPNSVVPPMSLSSSTSQEKEKKREKGV